MTRARAFYEDPRTKKLREVRLMGSKLVSLVYEELPVFVSDLTTKQRTPFQIRNGIYPYGIPGIMPKKIEMNLHAIATDNYGGRICVYARSEEDAARVADMAYAEHGSSAVFVPEYEKPVNE